MSVVAASDSNGKMAGFLDSLVDSSPDTSSKSIKNHLVRIDNEITRVQTDIQSTIKAGWSDFQHQSITGSTLYHQSVNLEAQLNQIDEKLDDPQNGLVPNLLSAIKHHQAVTAQHSESSQNLKAIQSLSAAYHQLAILSKLVHSDDLITAVSKLPQTKSEVSLLKQYQSASSLAKRAVHRIQELEEDLKQRLIDDVRACVTFQDEHKQTEDSIFKFNLFVNARTPQQPQSLIQWNSAVDALQTLSGQEFITAHLQRISNVLIEKIVTPLINSVIDTSTHLKLIPTETSNESCCALTFEQQAEGNWLDLYDSFRLLLSTLQDKLLTKSLQNTFSQYLCSPLEAKLLTEALDSGLPSSPRDKVRLSQLMNLLDQTRLFGNWLQDHDWLSNRQKNRLVEWCNNVQDRFLHKVATRVLERARSEMVTTQWESVVVQWEIIPEAEIVPLTRKETGAGHESSPAIHSPTSSAPVDTANYQSSESPKQAAGFRSLFNLVSSTSHHNQPSADTISKPPSQQPASSTSPSSKNFRSLFNFGPERETVLNPEASDEPSSSSTEKTSSPEIIDRLSESSLPTSQTNKPSSPSSSLPTSLADEANKKPEEDVDWDMSGELLADPATSYTSTSTKSHAPSLKDTLDEEVEEDAWGLDESNEEPVLDVESQEDGTTVHESPKIQEHTSATINPTSLLDKELNQGEEEEDPDPDAWGFEQEEATPTADEVMRLRGGLPSPVTSEIDDDGWGWTDDIPSENPTQEINQPQENPASNHSNTAVPDNLSLGKTVHVGQLTISTLAQRVLEIVQEVVDDAAETEKPDFPSPFLSQSAPGLIKLALDVVDLFRIVMFVHHSKLLDSVPSLSVQFSNDCDWLSKQVQLIPRLNNLEETTKLSERLKALGVTVREKQMTNQTAALMECLNEAEGFVKTSREDRFSACERACKQVTHTLASLAQVWKPVMLRSEYLNSLGRLVESVLQRILNEIEEQIDIEENDSKQLNIICKSLHPLIKLFDLQPDFDHADIYRYVPSWFKFCFLSELLEASMADIMWMYQEGHLSEFSRQEIVRLIKALFADSHLRAKNIDLILSNQ
ncbi:hypothetical protein PtB15_2B523 [Puccinia triticina]|nr:hypothetical protein PtB15_2B523 [Puccinia triticina]